MPEFNKICSIQDSFWVLKTTNHNNHEDTVKLTPEMFSLIENFLDADDYVDVTLYKQDFIQSVLCIARDLSLLEEKHPSRVYEYNNDFYSRFILPIEYFFGNSPKKKFKIKVRDKQRLLIALPKTLETFTPRMYIVEGMSLVAIKVSDSGTISLRIEYTDSNDKKQLAVTSEFLLQQIFYGAPGTGKSHTIETEIKGKDVIRVTFHPDSDYSTFVGAYKPTTVDVPIRDVTGKVIKENGEEVTETRIVYKYVPQAFLKAYVKAWQDLTKPVFLVIEEINRGNCAQIFGDIFQLLDRNDNGYSNYEIDPDMDIQAHLAKEFAKDGVDESASENIKSGKKMLLPPNLYIWATMNTSDQSLFPIDSAFKRRWVWDYVKITDGKKGWTIQGADYSCDWWTFIQEINKKIATATSSDDKKLGYFFCKTKKDETIIDEKTFVSKVIFYLWNDVFKDNDNTIFKVDESNGEPSFDDFYIENAEGKIVANSLSVKKFLINVVGEKNVTILNNPNEENEQNPQSEEQESATQPIE